MCHTTQHNTIELTNKYFKLYCKRKCSHVGIFIGSLIFSTAQSPDYEIPSWIPKFVWEKYLTDRNLVRQKKLVSHLLGIKCPKTLSTKSHTIRQNNTFILFCSVRTVVETSRILNTLISLIIKTIFWLGIAVAFFIYSSH